MEDKSCGERHIFKVIIGFALLFAILFIVDRAGAFIMGKVHGYSNDTTAPKLRYLAEECDDDIVILGTSRAGSHYVSRIMEDSLKLSVYNGGIDASNNIYSHYFALMLLLSHHTPKTVILEFMDADYAVQDTPYKALAFFAPYIGVSPEADSLFMESGDYVLYHISHLLRYNAKSVSNIGGLMASNQQRETKGFIAAPEGKLCDEELIFEKKRPVDNNKLKYLKAFINECHSRRISVVLTVSPRYTEASKDLYDPIKRLSDSLKVTFMDFHSSKLFQDSLQLFNDRTHLTRRGAELYTQYFISNFRDKLKK